MSLGSSSRPIWPDIFCKFHPLRGLYNRVTVRGVYNYISYIVSYPVVLDVCKGKFLLLSLRVVTIIGAPFLLSLEINLTSLSPLLSFPLLLVRSAVIYNHMIVLEICILFSLLLCFGDNFLHLCWS